MFLTEEVVVDQPFGVASARLTSLIRRGGLSGASRTAYRDGIDSLIRVGPLGGVPGIAKLVRVQFLECARAGDCLRFGLRWEATGPTASLFPVLDADVTLVPHGERATTLALSGAYRPPLGRVGAGLDRTMLGRVASASIRALLRCLADEIADPASAQAGGADGAPQLPAGRQPPAAGLVVRPVPDTGAPGVPR